MRNSRQTHVSLADPHRTSSGCWTATTSGSRLDWATGDEPMTGAQASYLETLSREAGEEAPPADLTKAPGVRAHRRAPAADGAGRLARLTPSPRSATWPGEHHETRTTVTLASKSGQVPAEPSKADQDTTITSLSWMIGASLA